MSSVPMPDNSKSSEGQIWPVNDPPIVLTTDVPDKPVAEDGVIEPVNDSVLTLRPNKP